MPKLGTYGSERGARGNSCPYRDPQSTIVEQLLDAAENFLQTPRKRAADRRLAGEEVRNPTLEPLDRTEGTRSHRIQIEQAAKLIFPE